MPPPKQGAHTLSPRLFDCDDDVRQRDKYIAFLSKVDMLGSLTDSERMNLADALVPIDFKAGEIAIREGDSDADRFYIVESVRYHGCNNVCHCARH